MRKLLSKLFKSKIKWEFQPGELLETKQKLNNPARGWYTIYPFLLEEEPDFNELFWCLQKEETLALVIINIGAYRERYMDEEALNRIRRIIKFFADHSYDVILRITYDHEGNAVEREPFFFKYVTGHLEQLLPVVKEVSKNIFVLQGMLVGNWGEMHTSRFVSPEKLKQLWCILNMGLEGSTFLAVRRPSMWRLLHPEECGKAQPVWDTMALFDDAIFGSESHMGTFGTVPKENAAWDSVWSRQDELAFEEQMCRQVPNGGEVVCGKEYTENFSPAATEEVLRQMHITYLNRAYDETILNQWKQWEWQDGNFYEYVGDYLGYRFCIRKAEVLPGEHAEELTVSVTIENTGFANCYQEAEVLLEWVDAAGNGTETVLESDIRAWNSGSTQKIFGTIALADVDLYLSVRRKSDGRRIYFANRADASGRVYLGKIKEVQLP